MKYLIWLSNDCISVKEIGNAHSANLKDLGSKIHAIKHHVEERGLLNRLAFDVNLVDYPDVVDIMMEQCDKIITL